MNRLKASARKHVQSNADVILQLSHRLHANPEVAWEEFQAVTWLSEALTQYGYEATAGYCGLPTAFLARTGRGPLHLAFCAEYDALPELGHACGHNIIAGAAVGCAIALQPLAEQLGITVSIIGTPAEEGGGGKIKLLERGGFDGQHAAVMVHPGPFDIARAEPFAVSHLRVAFEGKASHAAAYPERGVNAADAFTVAQVAIGLLRQQLRSSVRVHGLITRGGESPNSIPERTVGRWYIRAATLEELSAFEPRILRCFEAGALATGTKLSIEYESSAYAEFETDEDLLTAYVRNAIALGRKFAEPNSDTQMSRASTDMGNVSHQLPAIHPYIGIDSFPAVNHQAEFASHCISKAADGAVLDAAMAMAWTAIDVATNEQLRNRLLS